MVKLFKKKTNFTDKDGKERTATKFYVQCGDVLIPIEVTYFKSSDGVPDKAYPSRKQVLSAFAENLPELEKKDKPVVDTPDSATEKLVPIADDLPS